MTGVCRHGGVTLATLDVVFEAVVGSSMPVLAERSSGAELALRRMALSQARVLGDLGSREDVPSAAMVCLLRARCVLTGACCAHHPLDSSCVNIVVGEHMSAQARHASIGDRVAVPDGVAVTARDFHVVDRAERVLSSEGRFRPVPTACCLTRPP
jgi:hypothetical protein